MNFTFKVIDNPRMFPYTGGQYFIDLTVPTDELPVEPVHGVNPYIWDKTGSSSVAFPGKGKYFPTVDQAVRSLIRKVKSEVKGLEGDGDLKPSKVRRLEVLRKFLDDGQDTGMDVIEHNFV